MHALAWCAHAPLLAAGAAAEDAPHAVEAAAATAGAARDGSSRLLVYFAVLLLLVLAASTTARPFLRWMRHPIVATYAGGGWLWLALGAAIGPNALGVVGAEAIEQLRPAILVAVGWIGLTIGIQFDPRSLRGIPAIAWRWALLDLALSAASALVIVGALVGVWYQVDLTHGAWTAVPVLVLFAVLSGWNPETRSLLRAPSAAARRLARLSSGTAALASAMLVLVFGTASQFIVRDAMGVPHISWNLGLVAAVSAPLFAIGGALAIRFLLRRGDWSMSRTLVVVLSLAALSAGVAAQLAFSPLVTAMLAGTAVACLPGTLKLSVWRLLSRSERAVATLFFLLAGAMLAVPGSPWTLAVAVLAGAVRLWGKPLLARAVLGGELAHAGPNRGAVLAGTSRQAALAIVIATSGVVEENSPALRDLLLVAVVAGLAGTLRAVGRAAHEPARTEEA